MRIHSGSIATNGPRTQYAIVQWRIVRQRNAVGWTRRTAWFYYVTLPTVNQNLLIITGAFMQHSIFKLNLCPENWFFFYFWVNFRIAFEAWSFRGLCAGFRWNCVRTLCPHTSRSCGSGRGRVLCSAFIPRAFLPLHMHAQHTGFFFVPRSVTHFNKPLCALLSVSRRAGGGGGSGPIFKDRAAQLCVWCRTRSQFSANIACVSTKLIEKYYKTKKKKTKFTHQLDNC